MLAENGLPSSEVETSGEVTVDPVGELLVHTNVYTCTVITSSDCHQCLSNSPIVLDTYSGIYTIH